MEKSGGLAENRQGKGNKKKKLIILAAALIFFLIAGAELLYQYYRHPASILQPGRALEGVDWEHEVARDFDKDLVNIALLGFDRTASRDRRYRLYRPDTIMIASINFRTRQVAVASIPRDSYVRIVGTDAYDKINTAYMYGHDSSDGEENRHQSGIQTTLRTIQNFLGGVPLHYYFYIEMDALVEIIDRLGGIEYEVDLQVREPGDNRLLLDRGLQILSGKQFLDYVRFRGVGGDFGRIDRQHNILLAAFSQLKERGKLTDIPAVYRTLTENVETNLTAAQIGSLALFARELDLSSVSFFSFPGSAQYATRGGQDILYLVINEKARVELIKAIFGVEVAENTQIVLPGKRASAGLGSGEELPSPVEELPSPGEELPSGEDLLTSAE